MPTRSCREHRRSASVLKASAYVVGNPKHLSDLRKIEATLRVSCRRCGHAREFDIGELAQILMAKRKSDVWTELPQHFRCQCGARRPRLLPIPFGARRGA